MRLIDADALIEELRDWTDPSVLTFINNAPTVEPCYNISSCSDCKNYDKENHNCPRYCEVIKEALTAIKSRPKGEWIPVSERLPNDRDWYLGIFKEPDTDYIGIPYICDDSGEVTKGTTNEGWILRHCTDVDNPSDYFRNLICVAWQPLPEPYKKGDAE